MADGATVAVSGYYGCGNAGDEAVLAGIQAAFLAVAGDRVRLLALSQDPEATRALHGMEARYRMRPSVVRDALRESDLLLSGGGSLLQDTTSVRSLVYYLWVAWLARKQGLPVMFYAQGMGPFRRRISRLLVRTVANRVTYITVRDKPSERLLRSIGVRVPPIEVTADPAFALRPAPSEALDAAWSANGLPDSGSPRVGVALRAWGSDPVKQAREYAALLKAVEVRSGAQLVMVPMQHPQDLVFSDAVTAELGHDLPCVRTPLGPDVLLGLVGRFDAVLAMRLHTLIFAGHMAVPLVALAYDPKVSSLMEGPLELADYAVACTGFDPDTVAEKLNSLLLDRQQVSEHLAGRSRELEALALRNAEIALSLLAARHS